MEEKAPNDIKASYLAFPASPEVENTLPAPRKRISDSSLYKRWWRELTVGSSWVCNFLRRRVTMVGLTNRLFSLSLVVAIPSILYLNWYPLLNKYGGRIDVTDPSHLLQHINRGPVNNEKCWTFPGMISPTRRLSKLTMSRGEGM